ncbi:PAS domain-containing protein [Halorientalis salina]|uniref:PAS domain-containing protein n=1 Tax=Halorientalis salina TaxID=2932266 RepID=UPI0010AB505C|nr:PAS domain S-box protein [Halorientalis salina]
MPPVSTDDEADTWADTLDGGFCRAVAEHVPAAVITVDRELTVLFANPAVERVLGYEPETLVGRQLEAVIPERRRRDELERLEEAVCEPDTAGSELQLRVETDSGRERSLSLSVTEHEYDGETVFTGVVRDVSERQQTTELEQQRELFERVQDLADVGIWEYDPTTEELTWSAGVREIHGVDESFEPTMADAIEFYHPADRDEIERLIARALEDGEFYDTDLRIVRADGDVRDVRSRGEVVTDAEGNVELLRGVFQDITERKERERELERYEALAENMDEMAFVVGADRQLEYANRSATAYTGRSTEDLVGRSVTSLVSEFVVDEGAPERFERALRDVFDHENGAEPDRLEGRLKLPSGEVVVEYQFSSFVSDGERKAIVVARDVTERRERERELLESQKRQRALFEQSPDAIIVHDGDGAILDVNDQTVADLGYGREELLSMNAADIETGIDAEELTSKWARLDVGDKWKLESRHRRKDGSTFPVELWINKVEIGGEPRFIALSRDITDRKASERDSRRFRKAVEQAAHAVYITDTDGTIEYVNSAFEEQTGYAAEAAVGETPHILNSGRHDEAYFEEMWDTILSGEVWKREVVNERADGTEYYADQTVAPIEGHDGEIEAFVAVNRDITARKEMESKLRRREARFRMMFQRHSAPMLLIEPDSGRIEDANDAATEFYGYSWDELTGMDIDEINCQCAEEVATERKRAEREERNHFVFEHELASGETRTVEVHSSPIPDGDEELLFSVIHDITERREYERELESYKELVDNVPVGIYRNTPGEDGEFVEVNPAMVEMFDAESATQLCETAVSELYADPNQREAFSDRVDEEGIVTEAELRLETLAGDPFWASVTAITNETGARTYFDGVILDITERKEYEQRLKQQRDNLEILNQMVRHDIRNDLQLVLAYAELLEDRVDDTGAEYLETVIESTENAVELTKSARDLADVMLQTDAEHDRTDLALVLEQQVDEIRSEHTDAVVAVEGQLPDVEVRANEMLQSVFRNLLKNAIEHNDKAVPEVVVSATQREDSVVVDVADNGPGIPEAQRSEIFGKGEKGLESDGTGIGLYLVATLVEQYGGGVWISDRAERSSAGNRTQSGDNDPDGAVFHVELPKAE